MSKNRFKAAVAAARANGAHVQFPNGTLATTKDNKPLFRVTYKSVQKGADGHYHTRVAYRDMADATSTAPAPPEEKKGNTAKGNKATKKS